MPHNSAAESGRTGAAFPRVVESAVYRGPHIHGPLPMIRIQLDLAALEDWPSNKLPDFTDRLLARLPGLHEHGCCFRTPGGFVRRLREGTWLGHVAEHVALELQTVAGSRVTRGKTRSVRGQPGVYDILFAYQEDKVGLLAGRYALELVDSLLPPELRGIRELDRVTADEPWGEAGFDLVAALDRLGRLARRTALGPTTRSLVREAQRRGIPAERVDSFSLVQLGHGKHQQRLRASISGCTSYLGVELAGDKDLTKSFLAQAGLPVPRGVVVRTAEEAVQAAERLGWPVVTKPLDGNHGRGVSLDLTSAAEVRQGFGQAVRHCRSVVVEQQLRGRDHRILVIGGQVVALAERVPARVVGNGRDTIATLIEAVNRDPRRGGGHESSMTRIEVDEHVLGLLARVGMTPDSIPDAGQVVQLRDTANLSTGGTAIDRTDEIHPENATIARRAALTIGLDVAGIDFIATDIGRPVRETGGGIVEVNASPGFRMHLEPFEGRARDIARPVIEMLFKPGQTGRIPIFAVTGTNGKSTTCRMVACILRQAGLTVGLTGTSGIYLNDQLVTAGDASGPKSARVVLRDPMVEAAVLETARGGILREGLGFDRCDIGAVLNVQPDHLGLKGVETLEDLARVKSVVVEAVGRNGCSVLNADDPLVAGIAKHAGGRIAFFSMLSGAGMPDVLRAHIAAGGLAVVHEPAPGGAGIVVYDDERRLPLMDAAEIPATLGGAAGFNVQNALAAVAMTYAQGIALPVIRHALTGFTSDFAQNPGRLNIHDGHGFRVILDYAHNPAGVAALGQMIGQMRPRYGRAIGMISTPGDRRDEDIDAMGRIAAGIFDELVFRELPDRRGRPPGQVMRLLAESSIAAGFSPAHIHTIACELDAARACLRMARPGDLVVLAPAAIEEVWRIVQEFDPAAVAEPSPPESGPPEQAPAAQVMPAPSMA
jgi:cyanophycin synthetase